MPGPGAGHEWEVQEGGTKKVKGAEQAEDGYHAWISVHDLIHARES